MTFAAPHDAFCITGRDRHGKVVATHAGRPHQLLQDVARFVVPSERDTPDALLERRA